MKLLRLDICNFRKLRKCKIDVANEKTIFVGANNSGKTSAMNCLMLFLGKSRDDENSNISNFSTYDFTIDNWREIIQIGEKWEEIDEIVDEAQLLSEWDSLLPQLDVWLKVSDNELHHVSKIIPSLDWEGGKLGVRLRFEPKNIIDLFNDFRERRAHIRKLERDDIELWPKSLLDFLKKGNKLNEYFKIKSYILPHEVFDEERVDVSFTNNPLDFDPFKGLVKIDIINAQRGFGDANDKDTGYENLSKQLRKYYDRHLSSDEYIEASDLDAIKASEDAKKEFDKKISYKFDPALAELKNLNYPAFGSPNINIASKLNPIDGYNHDSAVLFDVFGKEIDNLLKLTERHNGLGYQNLISMTFKLMAFRDAWMKVGKASLSSKEKDFEPLHIVLIEEPEAHLHAQVQQVFIKEAYDRLRDHPELGAKSDFCTQMIVSTHSNHIVEQVDFSSLRYFKRQNKAKSIPTSTVINLSEVFGSKKGTSRFAKRYLKLAHADLFFADAVILVEGQAERLLVPYFIKECFPLLNWAYISLLEIGGSHAHTLQPLIDKLGIITLIIADIDAVKAEDRRVKVKVEKGKNRFTRNMTLKQWLPKEESVDVLLSLDDAKKEMPLVRVAYQCPKETKLVSKNIEVLPNTFEDALVYENENLEILRTRKKDVDEKTKEVATLKEQFESAEKETKDEIEEKLNKCEKQLELYDSQKAINRILSDLSNSTDGEIQEAIFNTISDKNFSKAEFALDLLYFDELKPPKYINDGLIWLSNTLEKHNKGV